MSAPSARRISRRSFLKLGAGAVVAAGATLLPWRHWPAPAPLSLRVQSALPLPGYDDLPFPEQLLNQNPDPIDVVLVPAYVAAQLIQRGSLQPLRGQPGRAHDPDGRYTQPFAYRMAALRYPAGASAPASPAWSDLWAAADGAAWPAFGRLITGAALLGRGYSPNDTHAGHLAQAAADLARLAPRLAPVVTAASQSDQARLALVLADPFTWPALNGLHVPAAGTMLIEYDWVILAGAARLDAARQFVAGWPVAVQPRLPASPFRLIPLMPLPAAAQAQHAAIWAALSQRQPALAF